MLSLASNGNRLLRKLEFELQKLFAMAIQCPRGAKEITEWIKISGTEAMDVQLKTRPTDKT